MRFDDFIKSTLKIVLFHKRLLLITVGISLSAGTSIIFLIKPKYESSFQIYISTLSPTLGVAQGLLGNTSPLSDIQTCIEILKSEPITSRILENFNYRIKQTWPRKNITKIFEYFFIKDQNTKCVLTVDFKNDYVKVSYKSLNKVEITLPYGSQFEDSNLKFKLFPKSQIDKNLLNKRIRFKVLTYESALKRVTKKLKAQQVGTGIIKVSFRDEDNEIVKQIADSVLKWYTDLIVGLAISNVHETRKLVSRSLDSVKTNFDSALIELKNFQKLTGLQKAAIAGNVELFGAYLSEISNLEMTKTSAEVSGVISQVAKIDSLIKTFEQRFEDYPDLYFKLRQITEKLTVNLELFKSLIVKYYELLALEKQFEPVFKVLLYPQLPIKPVSPKKKITLILSILFGLFLGTTIALWSYAYNPFFKDELDILETAGKVEIRSVLDKTIKDKLGKLPLQKIIENSNIKEQLSEILNYAIVEQPHDKNFLILTVIPLEDSNAAKRIAYYLAKIACEKGYNALFVDLDSKNRDLELENILHTLSKKEEVSIGLSSKMNVSELNSAKLGYLKLNEEQEYINFIVKFKSLTEQDLSKIFPCKFMIISLPNKLNKIHSKFISENSDINLIALNYGKDHINKLALYKDNFGEIVEKSIYLAFGPEFSFF